jgi:hypothetical protein
MLSRDTRKLTGGYLHMLNGLRKLFAKRAPPQSAREIFLAKLRDADVFIIARMQGDGIDPKSLTKEQLLSEIRLAAKDLNERQSFQPFIYDADGGRRAPFFMTNDHAQKFCGEYSKERNRVYPFQLLGVKGSLLATLIPACDFLVANDRSVDEIVFPVAEIAAAKRMWDN